MLAPHTYKIIANSEQVVEAASKQLGLPKEKFVLNYSTVDLKEIRPATREEREAARKKYGVPMDAFVIANAGRLVEQKAQRYLIEAFAQMQEGSTQDSRLFMFGEGARRGELEEQVVSAGLAGKAFLPGAVPIKDIIAIADVFTLPSLWEGMSLVLLEAMAGGLPIVASDVSGSRELIHESNGFLVPPKDVAALAGALAKLRDDSALRQRLGSASREEVKKYSVENNLEILYETIRAARPKA
jgi:glycosyltransferase involved in cell wall biosynthesis